MISHAWPCSPALAALFAPAHPVLGTYDVCAAATPLADAVQGWTADGYRFGEVEMLDPFDAFGASGAYDRFAVARLYRGSRAAVVHGWRRHGEAFESVTLVSPHPDASLTHLMNGTMLIRWRTIIRSSS